ncbi:hypothetical protein AB4304_03565 [Vibrio breoganii]|uniref:hypothetical protein n=1 Tax=Vibrio breoganii TaxID=553239 RepID=UPI000C844D78|nr:hypothetical protein [Vibrio breoganii]PMK47718.1 hypothetical protein BCU00_05105 [Vibrio breoganii]TKG23311.1 hypothetical protein FCV84_00195 [Vibrio breoganii]
MTNQSSDDLFVQVRTAHRLLAAYYQRVLPKIEQVALDVNANYWFWNPYRFGSPGQTNANPFKKWQWDLLPAVSSRYVFKSVSKLEVLTKGDYIVEFLFLNDSGVEQDFGRSQPDALKLEQNVEQATSTLKIGIYRAIESNEQGFEPQWNSVDYPNYDNKDECQSDGLFVTAGFEVPLSDLMADNGVQEVKEKIERLLELTEKGEPSLQIECES